MPNHGFNVYGASRWHILIVLSGSYKGKRNMVEYMVPTDIPLSYSGNIFIYLTHELDFPLYETTCNLLILY